MNLERQKNFLVRFAFFAVVCTLVYVGVKSGLALLLPFLLAFLIAALLKRPIDFLTQRFRFKRTPAAVLMVIVFFTSAGLLFSLLGLRAFAFVSDIFFRLPKFYSSTVEPAIRGSLEWLESSLSTLDPALQVTLGNATTSLLDAAGGFVANASMIAIGAVSTFAASLPGLFLNLVITIIVTFFITIDYPLIIAFIQRQFPERVGQVMLEVRGYVGGTLFKCILSYGLIMTITFAELSVGLTLLRIPNPILIAFTIAVFDILPVLGTGGIMIPWALLLAVTGKYGLAVGIGVVYLTITVIRNILEPKLVGQQVGLHPVVTLASMLVGLKLFGIIGLFGLPIALSLVKNLNDRGVIHLLK